MTIKKDVWTYWRSKSSWDGLVVGDNGEVSLTWLPEVARWCWPEYSHEMNEHWVKTSPLEYMLRQRMTLPEPKRYPKEKDDG